MSQISYLKSKKIFLPLLSIGIALASCNEGMTDNKNTQTSAVAEDSLNLSFKSYCNSFIDALWAREPEWATGMGYHKFDSLLTIPNEASKAGTLAFVQA